MPCRAQAEQGGAEVHRADRQPAAARHTAARSGRAGPLLTGAVHRLGEQL
jgi:hypothetical protein